MSNILSGSGSGIRDIEPAAIRPWRFASLARHVSSVVARPVFRIQRYLIRATQGAHNAILDLEQLDEEQLKRYLQRYEELAAAARSRMEKGRLDTGSPEIKPQIIRG